VSEDDGSEWWTRDVDLYDCNQQHPQQIFKLNCNNTSPLVHSLGGCSACEYDKKNQMFEMPSGLKPS
jgi:hypothetical protein